MALQTFKIYNEILNKKWVYFWNSFLFVEIVNTGN
jgi:hypothetical protein